MIVKDIVPVDFVNYKVPSMYVAFPYCTFKCEKDCGIACCHNSALAKATNIDISAARIVQMYMNDAKPITNALVCCGLEPLDSLSDLLELITEFRKCTPDPVVVYTGYTETESAAAIQSLKQFPNILVKFGRFIPDQPHRFDDVLGVELASPNQYAKKIS